MDTQEKLPSVFGKEAREAVRNLESGGILLDPIQRARDEHELGKISFVPRRRLPELDGRDSVTVEP